MNNTQSINRVFAPGVAYRTTDSVAIQKAHVTKLQFASIQLQLLPLITGVYTE